jgi:hypothetical protein
MSIDLTKQVKAIDLVTLTSVVRRSHRRATLEVLDWTYRPLQGGMGDMGAAASAVYRLTGTARDQLDTRPWSIVLKLCTSRQGGAEPTDWDYWQREFVAYQSGLLDHLPGGLVAPCCYGVEQSPEMFWLWLEDVADVLGPHWPLARYGMAARHLGQFNGAYLAGLPLPAAAWLEVGWLRHLVEQAAPVIARLRERSRYRTLFRLLPADIVTGLLRLWDERQLFLDALDRLPQTLCHRDAFRRNLFAGRTTDGQEQTVAIDWAFTGFGPVGAELAPLVVGSLAFSEVAMEQGRVLDRLAFDAYVEGLRKAGWRGERHTARLGYAATSPLTYGIGYLYTIETELEAGGQAEAEQSTGRSIEGIDVEAAAYYRYLLELAEEARGLLRHAH